MKKSLIISLVLLVSNNVSAQIDQIIGRWVEKQHMQIDTLDSGRALIDKDPHAYYKGYTQLDSDHTVVSDVYPDESEKLKITITKEQDFYWAVDTDKFKQKIVYDTEHKNYVISIPGYRTSMDLLVKYDRKTKKLQFVEPRSAYVFYEFGRQKEARKRSSIKANAKLK